MVYPVVINRFAGITSEKGITEIKSIIFNEVKVMKTDDSLINY